MNGRRLAATGVIGYFVGVLSGWYLSQMVTSCGNVIERAWFCRGPLTGMKRPVSKN